MFRVFREYIFAVDKKLEQSSFTARQTENITSVSVLLYFNHLRREKLNVESCLYLQFCIQLVWQWDNLSVPAIVGKLFITD